MSETKLTPQILAMYLGCDVKMKSGRLAILHGVSLSDRNQCHVRVESEFTSGDLVVSRYDIESVKPILRRLEDMTEEEAQECFSASLIKMQRIKEIDDEGVSFKDDFGDDFIHRWDYLNAGNFAYLLSKSFDLFGLIDAGLAIDAKTLKP